MSPLSAWLPAGAVIVLIASPLTLFPPALADDADHQNEIYDIVYKADDSLDEGIRKYLEQVGEKFNKTRGVAVAAAAKVERLEDEVVRAKAGFDSNAERAAATATRLVDAEANLALLGKRLQETQEQLTALSARLSSPPGLSEAEAAEGALARDVAALRDALRRLGDDVRAATAAAEAARTAPAPARRPRLRMKSVKTASATGKVIRLTLLSD